VETLGPFNETAYELVGDLGSRIATLSGDDRESFLSVVVQRFNSIWLHDCFFGCWSPGLVVSPAWRFVYFLKYRDLRPGF